MAFYSKIEYWDKRYQNCISSFEWHVNHDDIKELIEKQIQKEHLIMNLGCGNSELSQKMFDDGYKNITNIDFSGVLIKQMKEKYEAQGEFFKYLEMDARKIQFQDCMYDCVIDKGTLDTYMLNDNGSDDVIKILNEVARILNFGGVFLMISYAPSEQREPLLNQVNSLLKLFYRLDLTGK